MSASIVPAPAGLPAFYSFSEPIPTKPGTLIKSERVAAPNIKGTVYRVMYVSTTVHNTPIPVTGVIIVRGAFKTQAGGNPKVYGAVMAQASNLATTAFAGDAVINYSKCALLKTKDATGIPAQLRSRSWIEFN